MPRSVLIVDDHPIVPQALSAVVEVQFPKVKVVQAASLRQAKSIYRVETGLCACVLDLMLPDATDLQALQELVGLRPDIGVVVFTALDIAGLRRQATSAGASALVSKSEPTASLVAALAMVLNGDEADGQGTTPPDGMGRAALSSRQQQIWQGIAEGLSNGEIALRHQISVNTTKAHVRELLQRLGVRNRTEAAALYLRGRRKGS